MLAYVSTPRDEGLEFDREIAAKDSKAIFKAREKKLGNDEKTFIHIFSELKKVYIYFLSNLIFLFLIFF